VNPSSWLCNELYTLARTRNDENVELDLNGVPVLLVQRPEDAQRILLDNAANYRKNMAWFRQSLGTSRFSEDGDRWHQYRDLTQPHLNTFDRELTFSLALRHGLRALRAFSEAGGDTLDDWTLREMAVSVLTESFFALPFAQSGIGLEALAGVMEHGSAYSFVPAGQAGELYRERVNELAQHRRHVLENFRIFRDGRAPCTPLVADLLAADADPASPVVLEHELMTFFVAGAETSAAAMGWVAHLLAQRPDLYAVLHACVAPLWAQGEPTFEAAETIDELQAFLAETLRLFPPAPVVGRLANEADRVGAHDISADQNLLISFVGVQRCRRLHPHPDEPDLRQAGRLERHRFGSGLGTAFSIGPRVCGGKRFALAELLGFLVAFVSHARFTSTSDEPPTLHWRSLMLREGGHRVRVELVENALAAAGS
jgi:enediyne biosynthesis protein E7